MIGSSFAGSLSACTAAFSSSGTISSGEGASSVSLPIPGIKWDSGSSCATRSASSCGKAPDSAAVSASGSETSGSFSSGTSFVRSGESSVRFRLSSVREAPLISFAVSSASSSIVRIPSGSGMPSARSSCASSATSGISSSMARSCSALENTVLGDPYITSLPLSMTNTWSAPMTSSM